MEKPASGIILADKPEGISSQLLVSRFKRIYGTKSAGHTGTLDPIATGLNLICFGRATKVCEYITGCDKAYIACMQLGLETDTGDTTGTATAESSIRCTAADVAAILPRFTGELDQIPPVYSAIKVGGRKLYELARAGKAPEPEPRHVTIYALELLEADEPAQRFTLRITCSKGTYIRSLCRDIGRALNTFGTMAALRRTVVGAFSVSDALTPDALAERVAAGDYSFVLPNDAHCKGRTLPENGPRRSGGVRVGSARQSVRQTAVLRCIRRIFGGRHRSGRSAEHRKTLFCDRTGETDRRNCILIRQKPHEGVMLWRKQRQNG